MRKSKREKSFTELFEIKGCQVNEEDNENFK
jgi:hypothetical protein